MPASRTAPLSVIIPFFNEAESLPILWQSFLEADLSSLPANSEIVFVDDGSTDDGAQILENILKAPQQALARTFSEVHLVRLAQRKGQTSALAAGIQSSTGAIIVTMDADGQNDPRDISRLLARLNEGVDVVSGWRKKRQDPWFTRILPSYFANLMVSWISGLKLHDYGCSLKAYKREVLARLPLFGDMHRLLPAWCAWQGARVAELEVQHHPRRAGMTKYGLDRTLGVILDILLAKFFGSYLTRPLHLFGGMATVLFGIGLAAGSLAIYDKLGPNWFPPIRTPLLLLAVGLGLAGMQLIILGLLAEILIRLYHAIQHDHTYRIHSTRAFHRTTSGYQITD